MKFISRYRPGYITAITYMLQSSDYQLGAYIAWFHRTGDFRAVMKRGKLDYTKKIQLLLVAMVAMIVIAIVVAVLLFLQGGLSVLTAILLVFLLPWLLAYGITIPLWLGRVIIQAPREKRIIAEARTKLAKHKAVKIAIAGSYGKTTAKESLLTVLGEAKHVAATPGNMNTMIGTSRFIMTLKGNEEIIIFELGESHVGDVRELCELIQPDIGVITGINEAHLESFKTIENTIAAIFELQDFLGDKPLYKNKESTYVRDHIDKDDPLAYDQSGVDGWEVTNPKVSLHGTEFTIQKKAKLVWAKTKLVGLHNIGILSVAVAIADSFKLNASDITDGLKKVVPFEHRMEPRELHGAWVIDDTYNGNIEGVEVGLALLKDIEAARRIYVTPGLVEQGSKTKEIHEKIGRLIADSADVAVLMQNSVTDYISDGLRDAGFNGHVLIVEDPLKFYTNLEHFVAKGDVVLMQNDWTDNYA